MGRHMMELSPSFANVLLYMFCSLSDVNKNLLWPSWQRSIYSTQDCWEESKKCFMLSFLLMNLLLWVNFLTLSQFGGAVFCFYLLWFPFLLSICHGHSKNCARCRQRMLTFINVIDLRLRKRKKNQPTTMAVILMIVLIVIFLLLFPISNCVASGDMGESGAWSAVEWHFFTFLRHCNFSV